jgi:DNA-binding beta-propeller fold protein YncE
MYSRATVVLLALVISAFGARGQSSETLRLIQTISLPNSPNYDHIAVDRIHDRAYISSSGTRSVEVIDLKAGKWIHSVPGVGKPAGIIYDPKLDRVLYSVDSGHFRFLDPNTFKVETEIVLAGDADCMRWDPTADVMYVVNGGSAIGEDFVRLTAIDLKTRKVKSELNIPSDKLEFIALETHGPRLFINNVQKNQVTVVDRVKNEIIANWDLPTKTPYAMTLNEREHRLYVVTRNPAKLLVLDSDTGKTVAQVDAPGQCDDISYDIVGKRIYMSGGLTGQIFTVQENDPDTYTVLQEIHTRPGGRTSAFVQEEQRLYVPFPIKAAGEKSELRIYETERQVP